MIVKPRVRTYLLSQPTKTIENGWCHHCKMKVDELLACVNFWKKKREGKCSGKYCPRCVEKQYAENYEKAKNQEYWICYACQGICFCAVCKKKHGKIILPPSLKNNTENQNEALKNQGEDIQQRNLPQPFVDHSLQLQNKAEKNINSNQINSDPHNAIENSQGQTSSKASTPTQKNTVVSISNFTPSFYNDASTPNYTYLQSNPPKSVSQLYNENRQINKKKKNILNNINNINNSNNNSKINNNSINNNNNINNSNNSVNNKKNENLNVSILHSTTQHNSPSYQSITSFHSSNLPNDRHEVISNINPPPQPVKKKEMLGEFEYFDENKDAVIVYYDESLNNQDYMYL